ncbi:MAG TPA: YfbM family protein [Candidatus Acidoferrum sp.]|nr:YfbM family protein [Candidatus Acidoferrum sp.]
MGMEGKLRQVSEFELAAYRKNPAKFYLELVAITEWPDLIKLNAAIQELQDSPLGRRIRERALSGQQPIQEDVDAYHRQIEMVQGQNQGTLEKMKSHLMGLSRNGTQLSLYKDWHMLHYVLTGKSWEPPDSPQGMAIMGGAELPDIQRVMGYGPARYLKPSQVREVAATLADFPFVERVAKYDHVAAETAKVYPHRHPNEPLADDERQGLIDYFNLLKDFYSEASGKGNAMILWVE